jgi:DNA-binding winged helix-turn-helix (wHTH) protein/Tol biopolymer transport system component
VDYRFGPFRLDALKRRLCRGDEIVPLTPKALDTLLVLVTSAGKVLEKDEILKAVWPDTFVEEATLAQNISTLRRALGDTAEIPTYIATVPRRGYRFLETVSQAPDSKTSLSRELGAIGSPDRADHRAVVDVNPAFAAPSEPITEGRTRERLWMAVSLVLALVVATMAVGTWRSPTPPAVPVMFTIPPPEGHRFSTSGGLLAVSPDGRNIAFVATSSEGVDRLWLRAVGSPIEQPLAGTEGASQPFWSADSRFVAFFASGKLRKVEIYAAIATVESICDVLEGSQPLAGTWNANNDILFASIRHGIFRVPASGGTATLLLPKTTDDDAILWPQFLPDDRQFLYLVNSVRADRAGVYIGALDSSTRTRVLDAHSFTMYAPPGHLLFIQNGSLVAQPFDLVHHRVTGHPMRIADQVAFNVGTGRGSFSLSHTGVLAYRPVGETKLVWFDRAGRSLGTVGSVGEYLQFAIAPDDRRVAAARLDPQTGRSDIWILDGTTGDEQRFTFDGSRARRPIWSRDGSRIAFASVRGGRQEIYSKESSGNGPEELLVSTETSVVLDDWSRDGRVLVHQWGLQHGGSFSLAARDRALFPLPSLAVDESAGRISPDGRWLASVGTWTRHGVYVRPVASAENRWQIASDSGLEPEPRWRADGRELFFLAPDLSLMTAEIEPGPVFRAGSPRRLFQTHAVAPSGLTGQMAYEVASDGQRFLVKVPATSPPITVLVNWPSRQASRDTP